MRLPWSRGARHGPGFTLPPGLAAAVGLAVLFRLPGLASPVFMDEVHILRAVSTYVGQRTVVPPWFDWPPLFSYLSVPAVGLSALAGSLRTGLSPADWLLVESAFAGRGMVMGMRLLSLVFSAAVAAILWSVPARGAAPGERFLATLVFSLSPVAVRYGSWGLADIGMVLGIAGATWMALRHSESGRLRPLLLAGACTGAAAAFKYNGALAGLACAAAVILAPAPAGPGRRLAWLAGAGLVAIGVFLLLAPTWVLTSARALDGFLWLAGNVRKEKIGPYVTPWLGVPGYLLRGEPGLAIGFVLLIAAPGFQRLRRPALILMAVPIATFLTVGGWARVDFNYWLPALPGVSVGAALVLGALAARTGERRTCLVVSGAVSVVLAGFLILSGTLPFREDNTFRMRRWLAANLPEGATVLRTGGYTPKVWDDAAVEEYLAGRGRSLPERGVEVFRARLEAEPRAARVLTTEETRPTVPSSAWSEEFPPGTWVLASELPVTNALQARMRPDSPVAPAHALQLAFYQALFSGREWELVRQESRGSGQTQYAFRKRGGRAGR